MKIFKTYTGNAMLNNALMTVEALAKLKDVTEVTPEALIQLYNQYQLKQLNKRLKSYTMLFTKNGPLHNDAKNGLKVYDALMQKLLSNVESEGNRICEVSGLSFDTTFEEIFKKALKKVGLSEKEIKSKDTSLNRSWFPLIGGLGSDAQALPQAKYTIQIHPVCIAIMQFLPLSALLYKGGVLLIDSSNFLFAREFVGSNVKELGKRIQSTPATESIENVKDFSKGNYLLKALSILEEKEYEDTYSDLNLWSFSNSGTGASCEIERIPSVLINKIKNLDRQVNVRNELRKIFSDNYTSSKFLEALENNSDWFLLYPQVFGSGKKKVEHPGYSPKFLEAYYQEIENHKSIEYAQYLAQLIKKYQSVSFSKILNKTDAYNDADYKTELYKVLIKATEDGMWDLFHHIDILDEKDRLPIKNTYYGLHKLIHYYYQNQLFSKQLPEVKTQQSHVFNACQWLIAFIQKDTKRERTIQDLKNSQQYTTVGYNGILLRYAQLNSLPLEPLLASFYNDSFIFVKTGLNELLRIFFTQQEQPEYEIHSLLLPSDWVLPEDVRQWLKNMELFANDYQQYYFNKYENKYTGRKPFVKFLELIQDIPNDNNGFKKWLEEAISNTNKFLNDLSETKKEVWNIDQLLHSPEGAYAVTFARFVIRVFLFRQYQYMYSLHIESEEVSI
jgi:hypothetical protein